MARMAATPPFKDSRRQLAAAAAQPMLVWLGVMVGRAARAEQAAARALAQVRLVKETMAALAAGARKAVAVVVAVVSVLTGQLPAEQAGRPALRQSLARLPVTRLVVAAARKIQVPAARRGTRAPVLAPKQALAALQQPTLDAAAAAALLMEGISLGATVVPGLSL